MNKIGVVVKYDKPEIRAKLDELHAWASNHQTPVIYEEVSAKLLKLEPALPVADLVEQADLIITMGGDGTLISIARHAAEYKRIILGVNFGKLGFLTEVAPDELIPTLNDVASGEASLSERAMIRGDVLRKGEAIFSCRALNDAVIIRETESPLAEVAIYKDEELMLNIRADGLILSTPTGSTAYSLAAGGSIAYPSLSVLLLTAICPHSLTNRPLILPLESSYTLKIPEQEAKLSLVMDGQESQALEGGDSINIVKANAPLQFVRSNQRSYFDILREKLNWALS